ncbi:MAG: Anthranilate synthase, aminase component [uncultured Chloroflexi bacterium]|uniref:Anthranilate synthase component 1 n=1 Tax=uncultured Chloroflexota bacterium TaxID=166587 RepID=A0A6J4IDN4_9CHLR|nr:MAG: Anthranilate synthase, aminase component [uncultured Chloroflexota bacterium]
MVTTVSPPHAPGASRSIGTPGVGGSAYPTLENARALAAQGNLIPVYREVLADMETPVSVYRKIARGPYSFLLESVEGGERLARYSFIGTEPRLVATLHDHRAVVRTTSTREGDAADSETRESRFEDPLDFIRDLLAPYKPVLLPDMPRFQGGAVGYLAYECVRYFEELPTPERDDLKLPDAVLMLADTLVVFDHVKHRMRVLSHADLHAHGGDVDAAYHAAVARVDAILVRLHAAVPPAGAVLCGTAVANGRAQRSASSTQHSFPSSLPGVTSTLTKDIYESAVGHAKEYVGDGDIIQVVPSQRLSRPLNASPFSAYRALRAVNPSPYMYFLELDDIHVVGASPEMLVQVEDGTVRTRPIAGTRPRGKSEREEAELAAELLADEKERAEHIMLVDLGRNDVGRVARPGTVRVTTLMDVEKYSHVMHIVSQVEGQLKDGCDAYDALRSCFPAGTVSGAPKIRAMEIIAEIEPCKRGLYAGAVGYFSYSGNLDTAIAIRTMVIKDGIAHVQAGGGVVFDSVPATEYQETLNKAAALLRALDVAEEVEAAEGGPGIAPPAGARGGAPQENSFPSPRGRGVRGEGNLQ